MSHITLFMVLFVIFLFHSIIFIPFVDATNNLKGRTLPIPNDAFTPPNQNPVTSLSRSHISQDLNFLKIL